MTTAIHAKKRKIESKECDIREKKDWKLFWI